MRAAIYVRISLDKTGQELGVERQEQECREFCERMGWEVGEVFADNDLSATSGVVRPAFERLLRSAPEVVVCWHSDRFIRLMRDLERVIELEVDVHAVHVGRLDLSTPSGRMVARIVTSVAQHEGEQKGLRQRASHRQRAASGRPFWHAAPFGYTKGGELVSGEAEALRGVYRDLLAGTAVTSLAKRLNQAGVRTRKDNLWTPATLRTLLLSPRNAGINTYLGEEQAEPGRWEPVVDVETFRAAQAVLARGKWKGGTPGHTGRPPTALLSSIARCSACDSTVRAWRRGKDEVDLYACRRGCATAPMDTADSLVLGRLLEALGEDEVQRYWQEPEAAGDRSVLNGQAHVLRGKLEETAALYAAGVLTGDQLATITRTVRPELEAVEAELADHREPHLAADLLGDVEVMWDRVAEMDLADLRRLVDEVFERIEIRPRGQKGVPFGKTAAVAFGSEHLGTEPRTQKSPHAMA